MQSMQSIRDQLTGLSLSEQILLLGLKDERGTPEAGSGMAKIAFGGAVLGELMMVGAVRLVDADGLLQTGQRVEATGLAADAEPLRVALAQINDSRPKSPAQWCGVLGRGVEVREAVALALCGRGVLRESEDKLLGLFRRKAFPTVDPTPERELLAAIEQTLDGDDAVEPLLALSITVAHQGGLLRLHFGGRALRRWKQRLKDVESQAAATDAADAVAAAVAAVQAAVIAATAAATVTTISS